MKNHINNQNIKGILFDVDGTLYYQTPLRLIMILNLFLSNFWRPKELKGLIKIISTYRWAQEQLRKNNISDGNNAQQQLILTVKKTGISTDKVAKTISEWFEKKPLKFIRICRRFGLKRTLIKLQTRGYKLGIFSDYPAKEKLSSLGVINFFSTIVPAYHDEIQGFKPNTNGFIVAAEKMKLQPSEILYIGDREEVDGVGATNAGMHVQMVGLTSKSLCRKLEFFLKF